MKIGILVIGSEILNGKIQDKNAYFLANELRSKGIDLFKTITCADNFDDITNALEILFNKVDTVITSGGLGPTIDDITKDAVSSFFNLKISFNQAAKDIAIKNYQRRNRDYEKSDKSYENFPETAIPLNNPGGMAPGILIKKGEKTCYSLPGVPHEFSAIAKESILPNLRTNGEIYHFICRTKFTPELKLYELLKDKMDEFKSYGEISFLPHPTHVDFGITLKGSQTENKNKIKELTHILKNSPIKDAIWHFGEEEIEEVIIQKAVEKKITIATAESCTGGLNAHRLTNVPGSSEVFLGSIVSYANSVKENLLGVSANTLKEHGAVSEQTAIEMAKGALKSCGSDIAVSTTGIAGPGGGSKEKPVGTVWIGIATKDQAEAFHFHFSGKRDELKERFSNAALFKLLERI